MHLIALLCLFLGLAILVAASLSWIKTSGLGMRLVLWPNDAQQYNYDLNISIRKARFIAEFDYALSEGKFGSSPPDFDLFAGLWETNPEFVWMPNYQNQWITLDREIWPTGRPTDPLTTYIQENWLVLPAPLVGAIVMILSLMWLAPAVKRWFRRRVRTNLCLHCGYNLTGVESDKCPECGADRPLVTVSSKA